MERGERAKKGEEIDCAAPPPTVRVEKGRRPDGPRLLLLLLLSLSPLWLFAPSSLSSSLHRFPLSISFLPPPLFPSLRPATNPRERHSPTPDFLDFLFSASECTFKYSINFNSVELANPYPFLLGPLALSSPSSILRGALSPLAAKEEHR